MAWKKGETGNPGGRKTDRPVAEALRIAAARVVAGDPEGATMLRAAAKKLLDKAVAGDVEAFKVLADRLDGKAHQQLEIAGDPDAPLGVVIRDLVAERHGNKVTG